MQKVDSRWIKHLNVKHENLHLLGKNKTNKQQKKNSMLFDVGLNNIFLSPLAKETETKISTWNFIKLISLCTIKQTFKKQNTTNQMGEDIYK